MEPSRLRELLEAVRDDAADYGLSEAEALELREQLADDPALQAELARLGEWDSAIMASADDVPIPAGLADRLRATVVAELAANVSPEADVSVPASAFSTRRRWLGAALATAAAILAAIGLGVYLQQPGTIDPVALRDEVVDRTEDLTSLAWQSPDVAYPQQAFPREVRVKPQRWATVATSVDAKATVFDLVRPGALRAVLVAMRSDASSDLPSRPSLDPTSNTGNVCVGSWQADGYVYALVVSGGKARYQLFLRDAGSLTAK